MSKDHEPRFSELIWEKEERDVPIPPRGSAGSAGGNAANSGKPAFPASRPAGTREAPEGEPPRQLSLWEEPADGEKNGRADVPVPRRGQAPPPKRPQTPAAKERRPLPPGGWQSAGRRTAGPGGFPARPEPDRFVGEAPAGGSVASQGGPRAATTESLFVERAKELAAYSEPSADFVPFKSYWPTYGHMDRHQTKWYFYWRSEVRQGRYPDTDLSYIFMHVYELINGVGWESPEEGARQLNALWEAYRGSFKRLDQYLGGWIADFSLVHGLNLPLTAIVDRSKGLAGDLGELELTRCLTAAPDELTLTALQLMSDYEITKSRFFEGEGEAAVRRWVPKAVALVDAYVRKTHGRPLIEMFPPEPPVMRERYLFRSAVYDISLYGYSVVVPVSRVSRTPALRSLVTRIFRLTENKLRALLGYKGRLKGISIDADIRELVEKYLDREFRRAAREQAGPAVVIDSERLERLRSDSDTVRELLTIPEESTGLSASASAASASPAPAESEQPNDPPAARVRESERRVGAPAARDEDKPQARADTGGRSTAASPIRSGDRAEPSEGPGEAGGHSPGAGNAASAASASMPDADSSAPRGRFGYASGPGGTPEPDAGEAGGAPEPWRSFLAALPEGSHPALRAMAGPEGIAGLRAEADAAGMLPELVVDDINDAAMEHLGDLLIDGDTWNEEFAELQDYLKGPQLKR